MDQDEKSRRRNRLIAVIRTYFDGCNEADREKMTSCMSPAATHYFPDGSPFGAFRGAEAIARGWQDCVERLDSRWTIDHIAVDLETNEAVIEWTHFKPKAQGFLRGAEWYRFDDAGLILEIRAYYACPAHPATSAHQLGDFDYEGRGYPMAPPRIRGRDEG